jgi:hypothetical protein
MVAGWKTRLMMDEVMMDEVMMDKVFKFIFDLTSTVAGLSSPRV